MFGLHTDAATIIVSAEDTFRENMLLLGQILMQDEYRAVESTAAMLAELATAYLAGAGIELPSFITPDRLTRYTQQALEGVMSAMGDYMKEIRASFDLVRHELEDRHIYNAFLMGHFPL